MATSSADRYRDDVLAAGWQHPAKPVSVELAVGAGMVVEDPTSGFVGSVVRWENGIVVLEDRRGKRRSFPLGPGFWYEGRPVTLVVPRARVRSPGRTLSGSLTAHEPTRAKVALPSRIYVEGRHDAELVEKIWGDDLRSVGVVVEYLGGVDDLQAIVEEFGPARGRRLGVLVDHLVPGSKESRIAEQVSRHSGGAFVLVAGHPFIDIWQAVKPARLGLGRWPDVPHGTDWKYGTCSALGWAHADQRDIAQVWQTILSKANSWTDLERPLLTVVEQLIDFVTQDHVNDLAGD